MKNLCRTVAGKNGPRTSGLLRLVLLLVTAQACSGSDSTEGVESPTGTVQQAATAAEIAAVLANKIVRAPVVTTGAALSTKGDASVTDAGTLQYRVPIWVPDGVRNMRPSLAVTQDSAGGIGLFGRRWGLAGLSVIRRCQKSLAEDSAAAPIKFNGDEFCLDGERLFRTTGNANSTGEFRTRKNPFQKIAVTYAPPLLGVQTFKINQPDGSIAYYGRTDASRLRASLSWLASGTVAAYYLDKIQDRFGNSVLFTYSSQTMMGPEMNELVPTKIEWGGTGDTPRGQRSVVFNYVGNSTAGDAQHTRWIAGAAFRGGQRIESIDISAPDGGGSVPLLKKYKFTYTTPTISKEPLLATITECDGFGACKRPTNINWEPGTIQYQRTDLTSLGFDDAAIVGAVNDWRLYRRTLVSDLNQDGRDDIVYRAVTQSPSTGGNCLNWKARLAQAGGGFGSPFSIDLGIDADYRCQNPTTTFQPFLGDIVLADVNRDGYPDILSPAGRIDGAGYQWSYRAYLNSALPGNTVAFGPRIEFEESSIVQSSDGYWCRFSGGSVDGRSPLIAFGDIDGDAYPEIIRKNYTPFNISCDRPPSGGVSAFNVKTTAGGSVSPVVQTKAPPSTLQAAQPVGTYVYGMTTLDADGDGVAEILYDQGDIGSWIASPTMSGSVALPPANQAPMEPKKPDWGVKATRWVLDLNGDGLKDIAAVYATDTQTIVTNISTGKGFSTARSTTLPGNSAVGQAWRDGYDNGGRVVDYNLDGRQDIVLMDNGWTSTPTGERVRSSQVVLLSDGAGGFTVLNTGAFSLPIGDSADGYVNRTWARVAPGGHGYRTSVALDANGDGMPDFLQFENGRVVLYKRLGKAPDLVTSIVEGTGRTIGATYAPATDSSVYTPNLGACATDVDHLGCLVGGQWLAKSLRVSGCDGAIDQTMTFTYKGGLYDRGGLGFLGFEQRDIYGPATDHVMKTFRNRLLTTISGGGWTSPFGRPYLYPEAFQPTLVQSEVNTQGPSAHHYTLQSYTYTVATQVQPSQKTTFSVMPKTVLTDAYDCPWGSSGCTAAYRLLNSKKRTTGYDGFGNLTSDVTETFDKTRTLVQTDSETTTYLADTTGTWLVRLLDQKIVKSTTVSPALSVTRTTKFTPDLTLSAAGLPKGEIASKEMEPAGNASTRMSETYGRDTRGRLITLRQRAWFGAEQRTTSYQYEDADGVYVTTTTDPQGFTHRDWRHVGLGLVVRSDDENGASTTFTYDTLGRPKSVMKPTGERTTFSYSDPSGATLCGSESTTYPENRVSRAIRTRVDALGNETESSFSIDDSRTATVRTTYDRAGRAARTETVSTNGFPLAFRTSTYDDMNRVVSDCYGGVDTSQLCKNNVYDGLDTTTTNEAGRTITQVGDALGRVSITRASLPTGTSNATFTYGPFGLLRQEKTAEAGGQVVGQTDLVYDVLGRQISMTRTGAGTRETSYNSFGDIIGTAKVAQDGLKSEVLSYGRDALGRLTAITGSGMNRRLWWDAPASDPNVPAPNAKGKLVDLVDGATVHFDYYANGLLKKKTWSAAPWGTMTEIGSASYNYDGQGRPYMITYPKVYNWSSPLTLLYDYDPFSGDTSTITNVTTGEPSTQIWAATGRDELGRIYRETMGVAGGPSIVRQTYGYYGSGMTNTASLIGTNGDATLVYTYYGDKLPNTFSLSGAAMGGGWSSSYTYDNLKRLTDWTTGSVTVKYGYDADGNLKSRSWGAPGAGSTVTYSTVPSATGAYQRMLSASGSFGASYEDRYRADAWGRMYDTPAIALTYNAADEVVGVTEKSNGQIDSIHRDAQGGRVATTYGTPFNGQPWASLYTFDDLSEIKASSSGVEERSRIRANGRLVGELVRTSDVPSRTANFYLVDNVGNVLAETAPNGVVTARARRDPYGNFMANALNPHLPREPLGANQDGSGRLGFGDHPRENNWGVVDMQARFYNPALGRFLTADPIVANLLDRRSHNAFAYVRNNPVSGSDPMGLADNMSEDLSQTAGAVCASYGNYTAADTFKKKRLDTGLMSDFGGMSSVDDGDGGTTDVGTIVQTMADDLASYDPAVPRRRSGGAASSGRASPAETASVGSAFSVADTVDDVGKNFDYLDFAFGAGQKAWESSFKTRSFSLANHPLSKALTGEQIELSLKLAPEFHAMRTTNAFLRWGVGPFFTAVDGLQVGIAIHQGNTYKAFSSGIDFAAGGYALFVPVAGLPIAGGILVKREMEEFVQDTATRVHTDFTNMYVHPNPGGWNISPMRAMLGGF